jgi:histone H3/H4
MGKTVVVKKEDDDDNGGGIKKKRKVRKKKRKASGEQALLEIKYYQECTRNMVPRYSMERVIRAQLEREAPTMKVRLKRKALEMIQVALEDHIVRLFDASQVLAIHASRTTVKPQDLKTLFRVMAIVRGETDHCEEPINAKFEKRIKRKQKKATLPQVETTTRKIIEEIVYSEDDEQDKADIRDYLNLNPEEEDDEDSEYQLPEHERILLEKEYEYEQEEEEEEDEEEEC